MESQAIEQALSRFESDSTFEKNLGEMVSLILDKTNQGGKVLVAGLGKSGKIAAKISATLSSTGTPSIFVHPTEALHGDLGMVGSNDVVIAISYTGNTEELVTLLPYFEKRGAAIISMTGHPRSKLALGSRWILDCSVKEEACAHNLAPTASSTLTLAIGDALAMALMKARGFTAEDFAKNHPGGSLGRRLQLQVKDLMHSPPKAPIVTPQSSMDEILTLSTEKKLGAVLVCEQGKLKGIITDGDIRRALQLRERFFNLKAEEVMTRSPVTTTADALAYDALCLMEERESQISVLPVIDSDGNALGLLRIHDLVQTF